MITVSNAKVAGFVPEWATFRGFSILFDNPGDSLRHTAHEELLACDVDHDPMLGFYRAFRDALASLNVRLLTHTYLFCPLRRHPITLLCGMVRMMATWGQLPQNTATASHNC